MNLMALVFVLAEGQYVSADDEYSHRNIRQKMQNNNGMKNRKAPAGSLIQLKLEPNASKRSQGQMKEEHERGVPTFLSQLTMSSLGPEDAHHHLEWRYGERRGKPCAPISPLLRCPPYCVILLPQSQFRSINEIPTILNRFLDPEGICHHSKREGDHFDRRDGNSCYPTCPPWSTLLRTCKK